MDTTEETKTGTEEVVETPATEATPAEEPATEVAA